MGHRESTLCPAQQIHSSCRGIPPAAPLTHPLSFRGWKASHPHPPQPLTHLRLHLQPRWHRVSTERESLNNWSGQNSSLEEECFCCLLILLKLTAVTKNRCYPHILEPQMSGRCNSSSSVQVGNTRILVGIFTEIPQLSLPRGIKKDFTTCKYL